MRLTENIGMFSLLIFSRKHSGFGKEHLNYAPAWKYISGELERGMKTLTIHFSEWQITEPQLSPEFIQDIFRLKSAIRVESLFPSNKFDG